MILFFINIKLLIFPVNYILARFLISNLAQSLHKINISINNWLKFNKKIKEELNKINKKENLKIKNNYVSDNHNINMKLYNFYKNNKNYAYKYKQLLDWFIWIYVDS